MRILYVVHQFFPQWYTGTERFVLNLARQMRRMGHYVEVLTYGFEDNTGFSIHDGIMCKRYKFQYIPVTSVRHLNVPEDLSFNIFDKKLGNILDKIITKENFDIVHVAHPMRVGYAIKVANSADLPVILTLTDFWLMCPRGIAVTQNEELCKTPENGMKCARVCYGNLWKDKLIQRFNGANEIIKNVDTVTAPTYFLAGIFKNVFNRDIKVIRHGIEYSGVKPNKRLKHERDDIVFGYIGTILPHKGVHIVVEALKLLKNKNIKVRIYGNYFHEKEYFENLKKMADGDSRIEFLGEYKDEEVPSIMNEIDCLLVPSVWWENSPLTVLTSLAFKVPVITINIGGAAELVKDGLNGFNFDIGNSKSLANAIGKIAENPEILNKIKDNIIRPPRVEEEAFMYEEIYYSNLIEGGDRKCSANVEMLQGITSPIKIPNHEYRSFPSATIELSENSMDDIDHSVEHNFEVWNNRDWSGGGEEWTVSPKWKQSLIDEVMLKYIKSEKTILEIGPGGGRWTEALLQIAKHLVLVDLSDRCIEVCKQRFANCRNISYFVNNGTDLSFISDDSVDFIWSFDVFVHINLKDIDHYLQQFSRILRSGGCGIIHHAKDGNKYGGWRSDMTAKLFADFVNRHGLILVTQFDSWGNGMYNVKGHHDVISVFEKP